MLRNSRKNSNYLKKYVKEDSDICFRHTLYIYLIYICTQRCSGKSLNFISIGFFYNSKTFSINAVALKEFSNSVAHILTDMLQSGYSNQDRLIE